MDKFQSAKKIEKLAKLERNLGLLRSQFASAEQRFKATNSKLKNQEGQSALVDRVVVRLQQTQLRQKVEFFVDDQIQKGRIFRGDRASEIGRLLAIANPFEFSEGNSTVDAEMQRMAAATQTPEGYQIESAVLDREIKNYAQRHSCAYQEAVVKFQLGE